MSKLTQPIDCSDGMADAWEYHDGDTTLMLTRFADVWEISAWCPPNSCVKYGYHSLTFALSHEVLYDAALPKIIDDHVTNNFLETNCRTLSTVDVKALMKLIRSNGNVKLSDDAMEFVDG